MFGFLCQLGIHRWRGDADSVARRYRHNTFWDKTNNHVGGPRALQQTCTCCGRKRKWSFTRGCWRDHNPEDDRIHDTSAAWRKAPDSSGDNRHDEIGDTPEAAAAIAPAPLNPSNR